MSTGFSGGSLKLYVKLNNPCIFLEGTGLEYCKEKKPYAGACARFQDVLRSHVLMMLWAAHDSRVLTTYS